MITTRPDNFTYAYFVSILKVLKGKFNLRLLRDGLAADCSQPQLFMRHDVDVDLERALTMAEIEAQNGIQAAYMFIPNSRLYDIRRERRLLQRFVRLKHEVALHFDVDEHKRIKGAAVADVLPDIERDCQIIAGLTGRPVRSVSFHRPMPQFLRGELTIAGRINAYSAKLMEAYMSDSRGEWRNGEPLPYLRTAAGPPILQLLIHPIWWGVQGMRPQERLEEFYQEATARRAPAARAKLDDDLTFTIPTVRRSNYPEV